MKQLNLLEEHNGSISNNADDYFKESRNITFQRIDRLFAGLMIAQWIGGVVAAWLVSPRTWEGTSSSIHMHVWASIFLGAAISFFPVFLGFYYPGKTTTRQVIAISQMLMSGLLIHITGGRIETHFHIFGSLALLAFYGDWKLIATATIVTALDHAVRGTFFPLSVYGVAYASIWRSVEHAAWVVFESTFLIWACQVTKKEVREVANKRADLEFINKKFEEKTEDLLKAQEAIRELHQAQKLESIGQLAAGIAHEINTPIQFVGDNTRFLQDEFSNIKALIEGCSKFVSSLPQNKPELATTIKELDEVLAQVDSAYLCEEIPKALQQSLDGISRVTRIVRAMKEFSHPGATEKQMIDLNKALESTIVISTNEWKYVAEVETNFDKTLPLVPCLPGEFNQVILNLLVNSAHALADVKDRGPNGKGQIIVSTKKIENWVEIQLEDNGIGIPAHIANKIFDPFFTTKEVGKGTGQGLAIARSIICNKHRGTIDFKSEVGKGTTFIIRLPLTENASEPSNLVDQNLSKGAMVP